MPEAKGYHKAQNTIHMLRFVAFPVERHSLFQPGEKTTGKTEKGI